MGGNGGASFVIYVNKREVRVTGAVLGASEILTFAGFDPNEYSLFLLRGQAGGEGPGQAGGEGPGQAGGTGPIQIKADETVEMSDGLQFNAILKSVPYG